MDAKTLARFWAKMDRSGGPDACWNWLAFTNHGYGVFKVMLDGAWRGVAAHRFAYEVAFGAIPLGSRHEHCVCHRCDNRACVNPKHLFLGSQVENIQDRNAKARTARGMAMPHRKLTPDLVKAIRGLHDGGVSHRRIAAQVGVGKSTVGDVLDGKKWAWV